MKTRDRFVSSHVQIPIQILGFTTRIEYHRYHMNPLKFENFDFLPARVPRKYCLGPAPQSRLRSSTPAAKWTRFSRLEPQLRIRESFSPARREANARFHGQRDTHTFSYRCNCSNIEPRDPQEFALKCAPRKAPEYSVDSFQFPTIHNGPPITRRPL